MDIQNNTDNRICLSVIMSVFNDSEYVKASVESILNQSFGDFELIITDDASTDNTVDIIRSIGDERIVLICNEENRGLTKNLNSMLKIVRGEYIARMDGDDISHPMRFERQLEYLKSHPGACLVGCDSKNIGASSLVWRLKADSEELRCRLLARPIFAHPSFMIRKSLIDEGFFYNEEFKTAQDYEFCSRVSMTHEMGRVPEILLDYRVHSKQISGTSSKGQADNADKVRKSLLSKLGVDFSEDEYSLYRSFATEQVLRDKEKYSLSYDLIEKLIRANENSKVYDSAVLKRTMKKLFYTWIIRAEKTKALGMLFFAINRGDIGIFLGELFRTFSEKIKNRNL